MKLGITTFVKYLIFVLVLLILLYSINTILIPKYYMGTDKWPSTGTFKGFYEMERDSIDVLFLGSSYGVNNFIPQLLYNEYGIRSYNLCSEQQSPLISYYWLREALRCQTPKIVILEGLFLRDMHPEFVINTSEGLTRKAIDPMRFSKVKMDAIRDICNRDKGQSALSYYMTNLRYHNRWKDLNESDFTYDLYSLPQLFGWAPGVEKPVSIEPIECSDEDTSYQLREDMVFYFERMAELLQTKGIKFVLVRFAQDSNVGTEQAIDYAFRQLAQKHKVDYYNFREKEIFEALGADLSVDRIVAHGNLSGNQKNAAMIGRILTENYGNLIPGIGQKDGQYEAARDIYDHICTSYSLPQIDDIDAYLDAISDKDFIWMLSVADEASKGLKASTKERLSALGLKNDWDSEDMFRRAYLAIRNGEEIIEAVAPESNEELLTLDGKFRQARSSYSISSSGYLNKTGRRSSIVIDGKEYSVNSRGLNIVVYDLYRQKVVDSVAFDTCYDSSPKR